MCVALSVLDVYVVCVLDVYVVVCVLDMCVVVCVLDVCVVVGVPLRPSSAIGSAVRVTCGVMASYCGRCTAMAQRLPCVTSFMT